MSYFSSVAINSNMPDSTAVGTISTNSPGVGNVVTLALAGHKSCSVTIAGTWTGQMVVESTTDGGATWLVSWVQNISPALASTILSPINSFTVNGTYSCFLVAGITGYRVRATNALTWTGSASATLVCTEVVGPSFTATSVVQNILSDPLNISYTNLQPLSSYIGLASSTLGIAGIQMTFKSDQNCQITVDQSGLPTAGLGGISTTANSTTLSGLSGTKFTRDFIVGDQIFVSGELPSVITSIASDTSMSVSLPSVNTANKTYTQYFWDIHDVTNYNPITDNFGLTFQAVGLFFRVRIKNVNPTIATTYLRMNIALCPVVEALPRALSDAGNLKTAVYEIADGSGNTVGITPHHTLRTSQTFKLAGSKFGTGVDTNFWTLTANGTGSGNTISNGINTSSSGTVNSGYSQTQSVRNARYSGGIPNLYRGQHRVPNLTAALNTRRFGAFTVATRVPQDGFYFEITPAGALSVNCVRDTIVQSVSSGNFNGPLNFFTLDTNGHVYEIVYAFSQVDFLIDGKIVHMFTPTTAPLTSDMDLPIVTQSINGASGTTSGVLENWFCGINRLGEEASSPKWFYNLGVNTGVQLKLGAGRLRGVTINTIANGGIVRLYDGTSAANPIALIKPTTANGGFYQYDLDFYTGLWLVTVDNATDVTVIYE